MSYLPVDPESGLPKCELWTNVTATVCSSYHKTNSTNSTETVNKPTCLKDGASFAPKQCKGERNTGRCFCYDGNGKKLFGQQWWKDAEDMTCACSRKKAEMRAEKNPLYFNSLHCNSRGNYEPLQCDVVSEQCWCVDEKTGDLRSPVVPFKAIVKLSCYKSVNFGTQYLRQCESQKYARAKILHQLSLHGTTDTNFAELLCDDDGSYGAYRTEDGTIYCTWKDNSKLSRYLSDSNTDTEVTCNCARDKIIFKKAGKTHSLKCTGGGNYKTLQEMSNSYYCVDDDGYRISPSKEKLKPNSQCDYPKY